MENNALTKEQTKRLVTVARKIWKTLTQEEQEGYYNDIGTIGFVENVSVLLHLGSYTVSLAEFDAIHTKIFSR